MDRDLWILQQQKNMVVSSICYPHKEIHKQPWRYPVGKTSNQAGY